MLDTLLVMLFGTLLLTASDAFTFGESVVVVGVLTMVGGALSALFGGSILRALLCLIGVGLLMGDDE